MLEQIMERRNIERALLQLERNDGAGGVDGMQSKELRLSARPLSNATP